MQFQQLNGDPQVLDESNTPGYDETLKLHTTAMTPIDNEESNGIDNSRNAHSPSEVVLSKIDNSEHFNDTMKTSLKKWFSHIFSLLHMWKREKKNSIDTAFSLVLDWT